MAITFDHVSAAIQSPPPQAPAAAEQTRSSSDEWRDDRLRLADLERELCARRNRLSAD